MRRIAIAAALALLAAPAAAQTSAPAPRVYDVAPWWMDKPIIASTGHVWTEVQANRASVAATYHAVERTAAEATTKAADKARALGAALEAYGPDKVRVETSFDITPLYDQYRDKEGVLVDNERADKIEKYQVAVQVQVEVRDVRLVERVYATLMSARPTETEDVSFRLEPENETRTQMFRLAVEDARRRAMLGAEAAGVRVGAVRLIDPTGRACQTDVLVAGAGRPYADTPAYRVAAPAAPPPSSSLDELVVTSSRKAKEVGLDPEAIRLPLQPPMQRLESTACVVFSLG
jgi:uncharacterized protein YggE